MIFEVSIRSELPLPDTLEADQVRASSVNRCTVETPAQNPRGVAAVCLR